MIDLRIDFDLGIDFETRIDFDIRIGSIFNRYKKCNGVLTLVSGPCRGAPANNEGKKRAASYRDVDFSHIDSDEMEAFFSLEHIKTDALLLGIGSQQVMPKPYQPWCKGLGSRTLSSAIVQASQEPIFGQRPVN